jgi:flagellar biosynthesis GTPase FlhF
MAQYSTNHARSFTGAEETFFAELDALMSEQGGDDPPALDMATDEGLAPVALPPAPQTESRSADILQFAPSASHSPDLAKRAELFDARRAKTVSEQAEKAAFWAARNKKRRDEKAELLRTPAGKASEADRKREAYRAEIQRREGREVRQYVKVGPTSPEKRKAQKAASKAKSKLSMTEEQKEAARAQDKERKRAARMTKSVIASLADLDLNWTDEDDWSLGD